MWRLGSLCASTLREGLRFHDTGSRPVAVLGMWGLIIHTYSGIERHSWFLQKAKSSLVITKHQTASLGSGRLTSGEPFHPGCIHETYTVGGGLIPIACPLTSICAPGHAPSFFPQINKPGKENLFRLPQVFVICILCSLYVVNAQDGGGRGWPTHG